MQFTLLRTPMLEQTCWGLYISTKAVIDDSLCDVRVRVSVIAEESPLSAEWKLVRQKNVSTLQ